MPWRQRGWTVRDRSLDSTSRPSQLPPSARGHQAQRARSGGRAGGRARAGRGGRGSSALRPAGAPETHPKLDLPSAAALQSRRPASASRRHPPRRDSRTEPTRTGTDSHGRFRPPDARRACAHTREPGAGLASDTCDQQVLGPRPPSLASGRSAPCRRPRPPAAPRPRT